MEQHENNDAEVVESAAVDNYDIVREARDNETATQYNTKAEIRRSISRASKWVIYAMAGPLEFLCQSDRI